MSNITTLDYLMSFSMLFSILAIWFIKKRYKSKSYSKNQIERLRLTEKYSKDLFIDEKNDLKNTKTEEDQIKKAS